MSLLLSWYQDIMISWWRWEQWWFSLDSLNIWRDAWRPVYPVDDTMLLDELGADPHHLGHWRSMWLHDHDDHDHDFMMTMMMMLKVLVLRRTGWGMALVEILRQSGNCKRGIARALINSYALHGWRRWRWWWWWYWRWWWWMMTRGGRRWRWSWKPSSPVSESSLANSVPKTGALAACFWKERW